MHNFEQYTDKQLDEIYYHTVGYRPISEDGVKRSEIIEILKGWKEESGQEPTIPANIEQF